MKRILSMTALICILLSLSACSAEPPGLADAFDADFSTVLSDTEYRGRLTADNDSLTLLMTAPYTVEGMSFEYTDDGLSIGKNGMKTEINCDYIPSAALPSMLHNALNYLDSASYKGSEDGDDIYTMPTPYGDAEIRAINGLPQMLTLPDGAEISFDNARMIGQTDPL